MIRITLTEKDFQDLVAGREVLKVPEEYLAPPSGGGAQIILEDMGFARMQQAIRLAAGHGRGY